MPRIKLHKNSFTAGEVSADLLGRGDLTAYANGASKLRNVFVRPTGSLIRRPGLRFVAGARGPGRLVAFEFNTEQIYLLVFTDRYLDVFRNGQWLTGLPTPWTGEQVKSINWTQSADTLLVTHPDTPPNKLTRNAAEGFQLSEWSFVAESQRIQQPHYKFFADDVTLTPSATTGTITLTATAGTRPFHPDHVGTRFRLVNKEVEISAMAGTPIGGWYPQARALVRETLTDANETKDWSEQSFSRVRGYPNTVTFHQDRLVIGGSRDLPNHLWLSKSGDLFNFDLGTGLDDEAIEFAILSDQVNAVRAVFSGRHLQVFTSGAEWMVSGDPLSPAEIQLHRQTRIGSPVDRYVPPRDIDGATIFAPRNGHQLREFLFTDVEQAYQATDLGLLSYHLINTPVDMDYDQRNRLLHVVMADGSMATLTVYRIEQVTAWTLQQTDGRFLSVAIVGDDPYVLVERNGAVRIEVFDPLILVDSGLANASDVPSQAWNGFDHLEGRKVKVVADGAVHPDAFVQNGQIFLDEAARDVQVGLPYSHIIEPLPPQGSGPGNGNQGLKTRPIAVTFRLGETQALSVDVGAGMVNVPFRRLRNEAMEAPLPAFTGDKTLRTLGWQTEQPRPVWRIDQDNPLSFQLLSVTTEVSVNG